MLRDLLLMIYGFLNKILREIISLSVFVCSFNDTFNTVKDVHEINHIRTMEMKSIGQLHDDDI